MVNLRGSQDSVAASSSSRPPAAGNKALSRLLSNASRKNKSRSVENLSGPNMLQAALKSANSEMNVSRLAAPQQQNAGPGARRLRGATSEVNMSRLGTTEKGRTDRGDFKWQKNTICRVMLVVCW